MSKKHPNESKPWLSQKKIRRWVVRLALLGLAGAGVVLAKPDLIKDAQKRAQVEQVRDRVLEANTEAQEKTLQVLGQSAATTEVVVERVREVTKEVTNQDPEQIVNQTVTNITNEIRDLPQEQVNKIKRDICEQIMVE